MSIEISSYPVDVCVRALSSGSSGNCFLVEAAGTAILIDCGLPIKTILHRLAERGLDPRSLAGILLTHEHSDHVRSLNFLSTRFDIPVISNGATLAAATQAVGTLRERPVVTGSAVSAGPFEIGTFATSHDSVESIGFLIEAYGQRICYLTDSGCIPNTALEPLRLADLLVVEANHDEQRIQRSRYPNSLKRRILAPTGHLSNAAAAETLGRLLDSPRQMVWLAHLSAETNSPRLARQTVLAHLKREGHTSVRLAVAERDTPSVVWHSSQFGYQPRLAL